MNCVLTVNTCVFVCYRLTVQLINQKEDSKNKKYGTRPVLPKYVIIFLTSSSTYKHKFLPYDLWNNTVFFSQLFQHLFNKFARCTNNCILYLIGMVHRQNNYSSAIKIGWQKLDNNTKNICHFNYILVF